MVLAPRLASSFTPERRGGSSRTRGRLIVADYNRCSEFPGTPTTLPRVSSTFAWETEKFAGNVAGTKHAFGRIAIERASLLLSRKHTTRIPLGFNSDSEPGEHLFARPSTTSYTWDRVISTCHDCLDVEGSQGVAQRRTEGWRCSTRY